MVTTVVEFLSGTHGALLPRILKGAFLALLAIVTLATILTPTIKPGKTSYNSLRVILVVALLAVLAYQATWQLLGYTKPEFARFMRRYNRRPNAAEKQVMRGPILDRRGMVLAAPVFGDVWGRRYPLGAAAVHPLGYYHSHYGITAIERVADVRLSGYDFDKRDELLSKALFAQRANEGEAVKLTLDQHLQLKAYNLLAGRKGAVVVMQPQSGAILALVSSPGFDPLNPAAAMLDAVNTPAFNRAVQGRYPPGSVLKILIMAAALEQGLSPTYHCPPLGYIAGRGTPAIRDSEYYAYARRGATWPGWGKLTLSEAFLHSSNVYFAQLGVACGPDSFNSIMVRAQLNQAVTYFTLGDNSLKSTGGNAPTVTKKSTLALLAIGQGAMLTTPLHVAGFTAAIAADGRLMQPYLNHAATPTLATQLCSAATAHQIKSAMRATVVRGTGKAADIPGLNVCGKTGTAQVSGGEDHAWFTCFAPQTNPTIVVTVLVEHGGFGAKAALPIARDLLTAATTLGYLKGAPGGQP